MSKIKQENMLLSYFVDDYHKSLVRSWTSLLNKPLFIKGADVRALGVFQLIQQFQRDVGVFKIDFRGDVNDSLFWVVDFKQLLILSSLMLLKPKPDSSRATTALTEQERDSLMALAHHGGLALERHQKHVKGLNIELAGSSLHVYTESEMSDLAAMVPDGLCRVFNSHFEPFGHASSSLITVMSDSFSRQVIDKIAERKMYSSSKIKSFQEPITRILVADQLGAYRSLLIRILEPLNIKVIEAETGKKAMEMVDKENVDMIFYDVQMADVDGYSFARWLRRSNLNRNMPLVFCGTQVSSEILVKGKTAGMSDFVLRPPSDSKLKQVISKYLPEIMI